MGKLPYKVCHVITFYQSVLLKWKQFCHHYAVTYHSKSNFYPPTFHVPFFSFVIVPPQTERVNLNNLNLYMHLGKRLQVKHSFFQSKLLLFELSAFSTILSKSRAFSTILSKSGSTDTFLPWYSNYRFF